MVAQAGIDTWSNCWYLDRDGPAFRAAEALASTRVARGAMFPDLVDGHRVMFYASSGLLAAEGHPSGDKQRLALASELAGACERLSGALADVGLDVPRHHPSRPWTESRVASSPRGGIGGVRRLDLAVDIDTGGTAEGLALLSGVAAVQPPGRLAPVIRRQHGGRAIETVAWLTERRGLAARVYDKTQESHSGPRGHRIRLEDQRRWPRESRRGIEELTSAYSRRLFERRFAPLWRASKGVVVTNLGPVIDRVDELVAAGELTPSGGLKALGTLVAEQRGVELGSRSTRWRARRQMQELGLVLVDGSLEEVEVDLHSVLEEALSTDAWDAPVEGWAPGE